MLFQTTNEIYNNQKNYNEAHSQAVLVSVINYV